jgi:hypothetical protein
VRQAETKKEIQETGNVNTKHSDGEMGGSDIP